MQCYKHYYVIWGFGVLGFWVWQVEPGKRYTESDFNKIIEIKEREAHRVKLFMEQINQSEKTLVFCATQEHAVGRP